MRLVFFGTPELAVPSLERLSQRHEIVAVVCQPDKPQGRSLKLAPPPVKQWAEAHGIRTHQPEKLNDGSFKQWLREQRPDICPLAAYGRILKQPILDVPRFGFINLHPSLLPLYRGPSPIQSALLNGDAVTGVTIMQIGIEMDAGDILLQREEHIKDDDNAGVLTERLARIGAEMFAEVIDEIEQGTLMHSPQDSARATYCRMFQKRDGFVRWRDTARQIHNRVRASNPWPMAQCWLRGQICRILESEVVEGNAGILPGTIAAVERGRVLVATGSGLLGIKTFQAPGKKPMLMGDFLRGQSLSPGDFFVDL
jgi:methionyl-tRNA formyltransferase